MRQVDMRAQEAEVEGGFLLPGAGLPILHRRQDASEQAAEHHKREAGEEAVPRGLEDLQVQFVAVEMQQIRRHIKQRSQHAETPEGNLQFAGDPDDEPRPEHPQQIPERPGQIILAHQQEIAQISGYRFGESDIILNEADDGERQEDQGPKQIEPQDFAAPTAYDGSLLGTVGFAEQFSEQEEARHQKEKGNGPGRKSAQIPYAGVDPDHNQAEQELQGVDSFQGGFYVSITGQVLGRKASTVPGNAGFKSGAGCTRRWLIISA